MRPSLEERTQRALRKMLTGVYAGRSEQVSPVMSPSAGTETYRPTVAKETLTFSANPITASESGYDHVRQPLTLFAVILLVDAAVSGTYTVRALKNPVGRAGDGALTPTGAGSPDMSLTSGLEATFQFLEAFAGAELSTSADLLRMDVTAIGSGPAILTVKALFG